MASPQKLLVQVEQVGEGEESITLTPPPLPQWPARGGADATTGTEGIGAMDGIGGRDNGQHGGHGNNRWYMYRKYRWGRGTGELSAVDTGLTAGHLLAVKNWFQHVADTTLQHVESLLPLPRDSACHPLQATQIGHSSHPCLTPTFSSLEPTWWLYIFMFVYCHVLSSALLCWHSSS